MINHRRDKCKRLVAFLETLTAAVSKKHRFIGLIAVFIAVLTVMQILSAIMKVNTGTAAELDMRLWYTRADISAQLGLLGESGRNLYTVWLLLDLVMATCFMFILMRFMRLLYSKLAQPERYAFCLVFPVFRTLLDTVENCFLLVFTFVLPEPGAISSLISAGATAGKWIMMYLTLVCYLIFALKMTVHLIRKRIIQERM